MNILLLGIILLGIACLNGRLATVFADKDKIVLSIFCIIAAAILGFMSVFVIISGGFNILEYGFDGNSAEMTIRAQEYRDSLVYRFNGFYYTNEDYAELCEEIIDFNYEVNKANAHKDNWFIQNILYHPWNVGLEPIPLIQPSF